MKLLREWEKIAAEATGSGKREMRIWMAGMGESYSGRLRVQ